MSEMLSAELPWWGWALLGIGTLALIMFVAALFLPDWHQPEEQKATHVAPAGSEEFLAYASAVLNVPLVRGGRLTVLQNGAEFFPAILDALHAAQETITFQIYIFEPEGIGESILAALEERARAGVEVRFMVDAFGSHKLDKDRRRKLKEAGVRVSLFRPIRLTTLVRAFKRDHRRAIVVDGRVAFTGGAAVAEKWTGDAQSPEHWRDNMTRVEGPLAAVVQSAFGENWLYCTGEVVTGPRFYPHRKAPVRTVAHAAETGVRPVAGSGSSAERTPTEGSGRSGGQGPTEAPGRSGGQAEVEEGWGPLPAGFAVISSPADAHQPIRLLYWLSFTAARERIYISSSYFVPGPRIRAAVAERARAGVEVRILVPGKKTDAKPVRLAGHGFYEELLEAGVRIFEYGPTMMHAKTVVVDGVWCVVGSSNMDERSTELNEENNVGVLDPDLAAQIERGFLADLERSEEIRLEEWRRRPWTARVKERLARGLIEQY